LAGTDEEKLKFEYESLTERVYSREDSTLTITTLTTAGALAFLAIVFESQRPTRGIYLIGLIFSLAGLAYRELTVFTIDRRQLVRIRQIENNPRIFPNGVPRADAFWTFLRWFVFRCIVFSPAVGFLRYWGFGGANPWFFALALGLSVPLLLSTFEYLLIDRPQRRTG
jgi:hypothetical protein